MIEALIQLIRRFFNFWNSPQQAGCCHQWDNGMVDDNGNLKVSCKRQCGASYLLAREP